MRLFPSVLTDRDADGRSKDETAVGGRVWTGIVHNFKSPYLLGISAYMLLYSITSTLLYFQQIGIAASAFTDRAARTAFFAKIDLAVNILTIVAQAFITGRLLKWLGVGLTLAILPALSVIGFMGLGIAPTLILLVLFLTVRRAGNFAFGRRAKRSLRSSIAKTNTKRRTSSTQLSIALAIRLAPGPRRRLVGWDSSWPAYLWWLHLWPRCGSSSVSG